jgi:hypothetical protein
MLLLAWLLETLEIRAAARRPVDAPVGSAWPAMLPTNGRAERLIHALVGARLAGVYRMVPDRRRLTWRRAPTARPGKAS